MSSKPIQWEYGVTTVPSRVSDLLPRTLDSLARAGFDRPRLFIDGNCDFGDYWQRGLEATIRRPAIRAYGNWILGLAELYLRNPTAKRYAMFQDDFVTYPNLREYLTKCEYPIDGYWNLYTFPKNQALCNGNEGWYLSNQLGKGAVALVFSREAVKVLLRHQHTIERVEDLRRGHRCIDGGVVSAMKKAGWKEYVHNPSLVQHTGHTSAIGNPKHAQSPSFRGEDFDAKELLCL